MGLERVYARHISLSTQVFIHRKHLGKTSNIVTHVYNSSTSMVKGKYFPRSLWAIKPEYVAQCQRKERLWLIKILKWKLTFESCPFIS